MRLVTVNFKFQKYTTIDDQLQVPVVCNRHMSIIRKTKFGNMFKYW